MSMDNDYNGNRTPGAHSQRLPAGTAPASAGTVPPAAPQGPEGREFAQRAFDPRRYRSTFAGSVRSELRKMTSLRSTWIVFVVLAAFTTLVTWAVAADASAKGKSADAQIVTAQTPFFMIFMLVVGVLAVTGEYSSNTMRTTALSTSNRITAFTAKTTAVCLMIGAATFLLLLWLMGLGQTISSSGLEMGGNNFRHLFSSWFATTTWALMGLGVGYAIRSTAGSIITMVFFLWITPLLALLPIDFFEHTFKKIIPNTLITTMAYPSGNSGANGLDAPTYGAALITWIVYLVVLVLLGLFRYRKSDI